MKGFWKIWVYMNLKARHQYLPTRSQRHDLPQKKPVVIPGAALSANHHGIQSSTFFENRMRKPKKV